MKNEMEVCKFEFNGIWGVRLSFPSEIHAIHVPKVSPFIYMTNERQNPS